MDIKAFVFDIGQTLVYYPFPINWSDSYRPAFEHVAKQLGLQITENEYQHFYDVLTKYNTRINPREIEVSSETVFNEIMDGTSLPLAYKNDIKRLFYSYFQAETHVYPEAEHTLSELKKRDIRIATLSDVAYGMDNIYALEDIRPILKYIDLPYTSNDIGSRKPSAKGLIRISEDLGLDIPQIAFIGDERKDMECAHNAGVTGILINRTEEKKEYGQDIEIKDLSEILEL